MEQKLDEVTGAQVTARTLKELGVKWVAGIFGYAANNLICEICNEGIKYYNVRHEQTAAYMADGWARSSCSPGVCIGATSPGLGNLFPGIIHANLCASPIIALITSHPIAYSGLGALQESYPAEACKTIAKSTHRIIDWNVCSYTIRKGIREAMTYPQGPVVLEFPYDTVLARGEWHQHKCPPIERLAQISAPFGAPDLVEQAVDLLLSAEKAIVVTGDGIFWSDAATELREFVELLQLPVNMRRTSRGAVPEDHPLAIKGGQRQPFLDEAEVIMCIGVRASFLDEWFEPPTWNHQAKYIQVQEVPEAVFLGMPTDLCIVGGCKNVLRQMIQCVKDSRKTPPKRMGWLEFVRRHKEEYKTRSNEALQQLRHTKPIHPQFIAQTVVDVLDDSATIMLDGFTISAYLTEAMTAKFAGQVLDSGLNAGLGHTVGMGMGVQLAKPGKQVVSVIGDGGIGISGMDIETARRLNLPVVFVLDNNSAFVGTYYRPTFYPEWDPVEMLPNIRYDRMFKEFGCHTEFVESPEELRPALERAFNSGVTAVVNVVTDSNVGHPSSRSYALMEAWSRKSRLSHNGIKEFEAMGRRELARSKKRLDEMGLYVSSEDLIAMFKK